MKRASMVCTLVFWLALLPLPWAYAQAEPETKAKEPDEVYEISPMTVTAEKSETDVQKTPMSVDVYTAREIEDAKIETIPTLVRHSPNVHMKEMPIFHYPVVRGLSTFHTSCGGPTGLVVDDIFLPVSYMQNIDLIDLERAEILKGPQGTLHGRNTEAGLISITTKQPGNEFKGKVIGEYGSYNTYRAGASVSGPIMKDTLYLGGVFQFKKSDGYYDNLGDGDADPGDLEHKNARGTLRWTPTDAWDISFVADYMDADDHAGALRRIIGSGATNPYEVNKDSEEFLRQSTSTQVLKVRHKGESFDFLSVTTALDQDLDKITDHDFSSSDSLQREVNLKVDAKAYSQELRVSNDKGGPFQWVGGLYFFNEEVGRGSTQYVITTGRTNSNAWRDVDTTGYAGFGQGTYTLFDKLHLTAGLRLEHLDMEGNYKDYVGKEELKDEMDLDEVLPRASVSYDLTEKHMLYATVSRGYKAGGFNNKTIQEVFRYDSEHLWNYEAGIKTAWLNNKLTANLSLFYMDLSDKQISEYDEDTATSVITNSGDAISRGFELEIKATPVSGLELFAGFGFLDATFDGFTPTALENGAYVQKDYDGNDVPFAPRYTYNVGAQYRGFGGFFVRGDLFGTDECYATVDNSIKQDAYQIVNFRVGYEFSSFDVYLNVENLFDEEYLTYMNGNSSMVIGTDGAPRTVTATVAYRF